MIIHSPPVLAALPESAYRAVLGRFWIRRALEGRAGDVALFVSDAWHRGTPASGGSGRFFLQVHYARRDIAQRIRTTSEVHHLSPEALARATTPRQRSLVGLHDPYFYDA
jgi:hypothetical protein